MKSVHEALDQILPEIIAMSEDIYCHPELGFKEFRTRKKAIEALDKAGIPHEDVAYTGIRAVLDSGKPGPNIGLITEFDAVPTFGHPYASEDSCAAHTCGHYGQLGVMMSLFLAIRESGMLRKTYGRDFPNRDGVALRRVLPRQDQKYHKSPPARVYQEKKSLTSRARGPKRRNDAHFRVYCFFNLYGE